MVSRSSRNKIIFGIITVLFLALIYFIHSSFRSEVNVYSASDPLSDIEILNGIVKARKEKSVDYSGTIKAVIVPHHLVASKSIALGIRSLVPSKPKRIILLSPDHFLQCPTMFCTTYGAYKSFFGTTSISQKDVSYLLKSDFVSESKLFTGEHGVYAVVPFIKFYLPSAEIIPIAISQKGRGGEESRNEFLQLLQTLLQKEGTVLVVSSDFSHYLPLAESDAMDVKTQNSLCSDNNLEVLSLKNPKQSDCPLCLWTAMQLAHINHFSNPSIIAHTNSAGILHDDSVEETTSHFSIAFSTNTRDKNCPLVQQK